MLGYVIISEERGQKRRNYRRKLRAVVIRVRFWRALGTKISESRHFLSSRWAKEFFVPTLLEPPPSSLATVTRRRRDDTGVRAPAHELADFMARKLALSTDGFAELDDEGFRMFGLEAGRKNKWKGKIR